MKIVAIGDIHGRNIWEDIVKKEQDADKIVFIGDYFDTRDNIPGIVQLQNFMNILEFKRVNEGKVVMLVGNHDYHYMRGVNEQYSGYQPTMRFDFQEALFEAKDDIQACYIHDQYLFSHAGVTKSWLGDYKIEDINDIFRYKPLLFSFTGYNPYGDDIEQSPIWVRPFSLMYDAVDGYIQIVGHTTQKEINIVDDQFVFIDTLGTSGEYLVIEDNILKPTKHK